MTTFKCTSAAFLALLSAVTFTASAEARGVHVGGGHFGGHMGHIGHVGHYGHGHFGHHHFHGPVFGLWLYEPSYAYYDDDYADCYRVYRHHHWRVVCE